MRLCEVQDCENRNYGHGLCKKHYEYKRRREIDPAVGTRTDGPKRLAPIVRFMRQVSDSGECWEWVGPLHRNGYGAFGRGGHSGGMVLAHRFSYEAFFGDIPDGMFVCHHCDNPRCVNPSHLFIGTHSDNMQDMIAKGRARWQKAKAIS